jgi:deoxyribose-phosphate aldolase
VEKVDVAKYIDHTCLKPDATQKDIINLCDEAMEFKFKSVCINPCHVELAKKCLEDSDVLVCSVIGFPLGANTTNVKVFEAKEAVENGADEIDMVMNIGAAKEGNWILVKRDIAAVVKSVAGRAIVKVIIETCLLTDDEKIKACNCAVEAGANFVKTSTGFSNGGANSFDIELMRKTVGNKCGVKASGGIKHLEEAILMINSGANRLGTSNGARIMRTKKLDV